uniref:Rho guanine nucleotide exchange factor 10 n=1 Tax=Astyanax mexicanus TaxID=7994 RepID=A0A8B9KQU6_ASTMX
QSFSRPMLDDEEEGEQFEFDDSCDEAPEADRLPPAPPAQDYGAPDHTGAAGASVPVSLPCLENDPAHLDSLNKAEADLPPPPANCLAPNVTVSCTSDLQSDLPAPPDCLDGSVADAGLNSDLPPPLEFPTEPATREGRIGNKTKVNPYSVIDITPIQQQISSQLSSSPSKDNEGNSQESPSSPNVPSGYSVPVPCGYATPSNVPIITPAYTTPVIIRHFSVDEDVTVVGAGNVLTGSAFSEEYPVIREEDALTKWVSDPANTAWMENPDEVIYDDVPRENSGSTTGQCLFFQLSRSFSFFFSFAEEDFCLSSLQNCFNSLSQDLTRLKEHYEKKVRDLMANAVGTVELQQLRHKHEQKMQKLVKAAKHGTKDGLEKTKAAVKKGKSFIRTKSFCQERKMSHFEEEESELFIEVECFNVEPVLGPAPEGLSQQQVVRRCILESILESEKNYLEALKRILEQYEKPLLEIEPRMLSERKCKMVFYRVREILQCHALFQIALASRVADWDNLQTIGDVFVASFSKSMVLDAYSEYVNNFSTAMQVVKKACASKPCFLDFLKQRQECSRDRVTLYGLMMKPIQRFPQFILLLQDMLKNTPVGHADRLPLQMALTELETLAEKLNEKKREADQRCEIRHIAKAMNERYLNKVHEEKQTSHKETAFLKLLCTSTNNTASYNSKEQIIDSILFMFADKLYVGPGQLYQDLQNLIHDLGLVNQISSMIGSLKGNYQNVNGTVAQDWVSGLQRLILKKEEEIRAADRCRIQLQLPGKQDKSGRPTFFTAVFNTFSPSIKQAWISNLQMAKLALEEDNLQGWFFAEDDSNQIKKQKHPLLLKHMPVVMSRLQEFKVECAVHNPEPHINSESTADMPAVGHGCVWVASCTNQMGQIAIVAMQNSSPKVTECFNVESRILCMTYVPMDESLVDGEGNADHGAQSRVGDTPTVCVGMEEGSISVYKSSQRSKKVRLQHFFSPDKSTVTCLAYKSPFLYAGLVSGSLAVYSRASDGLWDPSSVQLLKLGVLPVKALLAVGEHVWASSGGQVFIINTNTHSVEHQLEAHQDEGMVVSQMVVAGVGIWIAFSSGSTLRLFHTETLEHLQDINIATPVNNILSGHQRVSVSSLLVCHGLLLVGTNLGVTVALSVPRLQGIPKVTGRGMVSFHAHYGPVKFLTAALPVCNLPQTTTAPTALSSSSQCGPPEEERPGSAPAVSSDRGVWLAPVLQDTLSSSCGSLATSHSSLEHGPEDGSIYDLLNDPAQSQKAKRAQRVDVSSIMVVSGGLGHRRVNRKTKQSRHEESVSTIMVWQIPILNA